MTEPAHKPIIFLAFANDRNGTVGQPLNLPEEERRVREKLEAAEGLCEFVARSNCTADDIFNVLQDARYRDRIAIFHFSGHANSFQLLLETRDGQRAAAADAGGLASFLAAQHGLRLVFLNGCSTRQQAQGLLDANENLAAVIATSRAIDDPVAIELSERFYAALAQGTKLRTAFDEATAAITTTRGSNHRKLYFGDAHKDAPDDSRDSSGAPWNLYEREGSAEIVDQWNLPEAANDPLFGLPRLPITDLPKSPYRHLAWFTRNEAEVFFGRGRQIRELYDRLTVDGSDPIMLFYGQSGVGKSSILDAGLIPRLEQDYKVYYLRRGEGGLLKTLQSALLIEAADAPFETVWLRKEKQLNKPLIVFLDQVEEVYTRPIKDLPDELDQLLRVVKATFGDPNHRPQGRLVLGFRKEWLAELESQLDGLPYSNFFLEPLDRLGMIEVVRGPAQSKRLLAKYKLTVEGGLAEIIADDLLEDRGSALAPTLQILLTKMWAKATEANYEHPAFTQDLYQQLKRDGILLRDFLNQQIATFRQRYSEVVDSGLLLDILALHTTPLGAAGQCTLEQLQNQYPHLGTGLPALLEQCRDAYLLTEPTGKQIASTRTTRLSHDLLAPLIRDLIDQSDKPGQRARRILDARSHDWEHGKAGTVLDEEELAIVETAAEATRTWKQATELRLVQASRLARDKRRRERNFRFIAGIGAAALIVTLAIIIVQQVWVNIQVARTRDEAETLAEVRRLVRASSDGPPVPAALLAVESVTASKDQPLALAEAKSALRSALGSLSGRLLNPSGPYGVLYGKDDKARVSPDMRFIVHCDPYGNAEMSPFLRAKPEDHARELAVGQPGSTAYTLNVAAFAKDGKSLITGHNAGAVFLWDYANPKDSDSAEVIPRIKASAELWAVSSAYVRAVAISEDGKWLAAGCHGILDEPTAWLWRKNGLAEWKELRIKKHKREVRAVTFSGDARYLATGCGDGTIYIWDLNADNPTESPLRSYEFFEEVLQLALSYDGQRLAAGGRSGPIQLWAKPENPPQPLSGHVGEITALTFDESGILISGGKDTTARVWSEDGSQSGVLRGHESPIVQVLLMKEGVIHTVDTAGRVREWLRTESPQMASPYLLEQTRSVVGFSHDSRWLVVRRTNQNLELLGLHTLAGEPKCLSLGKFGFELNMYWNNYPVQMSSDQQSICVLTGTDSWLFWELTKDDPLKTRKLLPARDWFWDETNSRLTKRDGSSESSFATKVSVSPDGGILVEGKRDGSVSICGKGQRDGKIGSVTCSDAVGWIESCHWSPQGDRIVVSYRSRKNSDEINLYSVRVDARRFSATQNIQHFDKISKYSDLPEKLWQSPDRRWLVCYQATSVRKIWDLQTLQQVNNFSEKLRGGTIVSSPSGKYIAFVDQRAHLSSPITLVCGELPGGFLTPREFKNVIASGFLDDSTLLGQECLSYGPDEGANSFRFGVWELGSPSQSMTESYLSSVELIEKSLVSPNGKWLAVENGEGRSYLISLRLDDLLEIARRTTGRELTDNERQRFLLIPKSQ